MLLQIAESGSTEEGEKRVFSSKLIIVEYSFEFFVLDCVVCKDTWKMGQRKLIEFLSNFYRIVSNNRYSQLSRCCSSRVPVSRYFVFVFLYLYLLLNCLKFRTFYIDKSNACYIYSGIRSTFWHLHYYHYYFQHALTTCGLNYCLLIVASKTLHMTMLEVPQSQ